MLLDESGLAHAQDAHCEREVAALAQPVDDRLRRSRRLTDKILVAFHQACDQGDLEVAWELLLVCEIAMQRPAPAGRDQRRAKEDLVAAFERLWFLRHHKAMREEAELNAA